MSVRIEQAGPECAEIFAGLHAQCFAPSWTTEEFASLLALPGAFACLGWAQDGDRPDALALAWVQAGQGEVLTLATLPEQRRKGAARAMVRFVLAQAAALQAEAVFLEVAQTNLAARALYAGQGFVEAGKRQKYYRTPQGLVDALVLRRALAGGAGKAGACMVDPNPQRT